MFTPPPKSLPYLYSTAAFLGASLMFMVQPLASKLLLPTFGGAATLWATANLFFQLILLAGYTLVHYSTRFKVRKQLTGFVVVAISSLIFLPIALPSFIPLSLPSVASALIALSLMVGLPFAVLSTTSPLLQRWYALSEGPRADDPYFIYAASNTGSFIGLFSYPLLLEPTLSLSTQGWLWSTLFVIFLILLTYCGSIASKSTKTLEASTLFSPTIARGRKLKWVLLAFIPSSLMLGFTTTLATDVGSFPLLWVIPLGVYLLTMILAFASKRRAIHPLLPLATSGVALLSLVVFWSHLAPPTINGLILSTLVATISLLFISYTCHALLAADRPPAQELTSFYVLLSLGGALGGIFNGFLAPVLFNSPIELYLVLVLVPLVAFAPRIKLKEGVVLASVLIIALITTNAYGTEALRERTFYGSYEVKETASRTLLYSGTTLHGSQEKENPEAPTTYYSEGGPIGSLLSTKHFQNVVGVGLGVGTIATYGEAGDHYLFFEIDQAVEEIARTTQYFTFLENSKATVEVQIEDGRKGVERLTPNSTDLIVLDAFSSDSVPVHLLTEEAFTTYFSKLTPQGAVAVHISNRYFDFTPVMASAAKEQGATLLANSRREGNASPSTWVTLTKDQELTEALLEEGWVQPAVEPRSWTDDYAPLLPLLHNLP